MFVVTALVLTFTTVPFVNLFYPERLRQHNDAHRKTAHTDHEQRHTHFPTMDNGFKTRVSVVLDKIDQLPAAMQLSRLISLGSPGLPPSFSVASTDKLDIEEPSSDNGEKEIVNSNLLMQIDALRLIELTSRASALLKSQETDILIHNDSILSIFRTFGTLNRLQVNTSISVVNQNEYPEAVVRHASDTASELVILPWARGIISSSEGDIQPSARNPFDGIFSKSSLHIQDQTGSVVYSEFIRGVFLKSPSDVALFVDRGMNTGSGQSGHHLFLPFIGGPDDRLTLTFLVQLCNSSSVSATVVRITKVDDMSPISTVDEVKISVHNQVSLSSLLHFRPILSDFV
jgi:hypothetical protein